MDTYPINTIFKIVAFIVIAIVLFKLFTEDEHFDDPFNNPNMPNDYFICNTNDPKFCSLSNNNGKEWINQDPDKKPTFLLCNNERCKTFAVSTVRGGINFGNTPGISHIYVNKHFNSVQIPPNQQTISSEPTNDLGTWKPGGNINLGDLKAVQKNPWMPGNNIELENGKTVQNNVVHCAVEGETCRGSYRSTGGKRYVVFGADNRYVNKKLMSDVEYPCSVTTFGVDPAPGKLKACYNAYLP